MDFIWTQTSYFAFQLRAGVFVFLEDRNMGLFLRWLLMPQTDGMPSEEFDLKQKQSVYNTPSSELGASQPLVKKEELCDHNGFKRKNNFEKHLLIPDKLKS